MMCCGNKRCHCVHQQESNFLCQRLHGEFSRTLYSAWTSPSYCTGSIADQFAVVCTGATSDKLQVVITSPLLHLTSLYASGTCMRKIYIYQYFDIEYYRIRSTMFAVIRVNKTKGLHVDSYFFMCASAFIYVKELKQH